MTLIIHITTHIFSLTGSKTPVYTIVVQCSGVPFYEATDDVSGWVVVRSLDEFHQLHIKLKEVLHFHSTVLRIQ